MNPSPLILRLLAAFFLAAGLAVAEETPDQRVIGKSDETLLTDKVVVLEIGQDDLINKQAFRFWQRILERAEEEKAKAVVLELDTPGGLAFDTREIITENFSQMEIPLIAWVKKEALSAGALISFSTDRIYMAPGTTIGAAGLVSGTGQEIDPVMRAKLESVFEASMRPVLKRKGHDIEILRAMMFIDPDKERTFGSITVRKNALLTLTADDAVEEVDGKPLLAVGVIDSLEGVLEKEGLSEAEVIRPEPTGFESFAWWIAKLSPILIAIGILAGYAEFKSPGFGVFGFASLLVFALFFFGNNLAGNLAGYELMALFLVGILLIVLEIFVIPGGIAGIIGGVMVLGSLWFAMADRVEFDRLFEGAEDAPSLGGLLIGPALTLSLGLLGAAGLLFVFMRYLPSIPLFRALIVEEELAGGVPVDADKGGKSHVGVTAVAVTDLRPSGTIMIGDYKHDAVSQHGLIEKGSKVVVLEEGMTYVVEPVEKA